MGESTSRIRSLKVQETSGGSPGDSCKDYISFYFNFADFSYF